MKFFLRYIYRFSALIIFVILFYSSYSQSSWTNPEKIYGDSYITVELSYKISSKSCDQDGRKNKFRYNIIGSLRSYPYYLNWKMDYLDCNGSLYYQEYAVNIGSGGSLGTNLESMEYMFISSSLEKPHYDEFTSSNPSARSGLKALPHSKDPESILGQSEIYRGEFSELTIKGGALGAGANWVWYKERCGDKNVGEGESLKVDPIETTTYFVRAEGKKDTTKCVSFTVVVNQSSLEPKEIFGKTKICKGESTTLTVNGGALGKGAEWVWYTIGNDPKQIGRGVSITVTPESATTYSVRAEGDLNKTKYAELRVLVLDKSINPVSISGNAPICEGEKLNLKVNGGQLSSEATWKWYNINCGGISVGQGESVEIRPSNSGTYFVRGEGDCNNTNCVSVSVTVIPKSYPPLYISYPNIVYKNHKSTLSVVGGTLGNDAQWIWYKKSKGSDRIVGKGTSVIVRPNQESVYKVRAEGSCNQTTFINAFISPEVLHKFGPKYSDDQKDKYNKKFLHIGIGLGVDVTDLSQLTNTVTKDLTTGSVSSSNMTYTNIVGLGLKGDFTFHPYMKDFFSIGLLSSGAVGSNPAIFAGWKKNASSFSDNTTITEKYFYTRFDIGLEIAAGYSKLKALFIYKSSIQTHAFANIQTNDYEKIENDFNIQLRKEIVSVGIRVAPYSTQKVRYKRGFCFDFVYSLSRDYTWNWTNFDWKYNAISDWQTGPGFSLWIQSVLKLQFDALFKSQLNPNFVSNSNYDNKTYFQFSLVYNRNAFY